MDARTHHGRFRERIESMASLVKNILITDRFHEEALQFLKKQSHLKIDQAEQPQIKQLKNIDKYHALMIRSRTEINSALLEKAKNLQLIITSTSGYDHIDLEACKKWGITVMYTPRGNRLSAAEHTWTLFLATKKNLIAAVQECHNGSWNRSSITGQEVAHKNFAIIGLGRIGSLVSRYARAFHMNVAAYDPYKEDSYFEKYKTLRFETMGELLHWADVVSFHVPKTEETFHLLNERYKSDLKKHVTILNTSRGDVIEKNFLIEFLNKNPNAKAALDVFETEPLSKNSLLLNHPQILCTPHIGANTIDAFSKSSQMAADKLIKYFYDASTSDAL